MTLLQCRLLGEFRMPLGRGRAAAFPTRKVAGAARLSGGQWGAEPRRDKLAALLWGDRPEPQARANLRKSLSRLRQALPAAARAAWSPTPARSPSGRTPSRSTSLLFERLPPTARPRPWSGRQRSIAARSWRASPAAARSSRSWLMASGGGWTRCCSRPCSACSTTMWSPARIDRAIQVALRLHRARPVAGERPPHADPALHVPGPGGLGAGPVSPLPRAARRASSASSRRRKRSG